MILWVYENALRLGADFVWVATDDQRIADVVTQAGGEAVLTSPDHPTGTDRLAEVARLRGLSSDTMVVNVQGDEPLLGSRYVELVASALAAEPSAGIATLAAPITEVTDLFNPNVVKVVLDGGGWARLFSRAPVPWVRDSFASFGSGDLPTELPNDVPFLRHVGLYGYRVETLQRLADTPVVSVERAESLEQLRALHVGIRIHVSVVEEAPAHGVDTEEDLARAERLLSV